MSSERWRDNIPTFGKIGNSRLSAEPDVDFPAQECPLLPETAEDEERAGSIRRQTRSRERKCGPGMGPFRSACEAWPLARNGTVQAIHNGTSSQRQTIVALVARFRSSSRSANAAPSSRAKSPVQIAFFEKLAWRDPPARLRQCGDAAFSFRLVHAADAGQFARAIDPVLRKSAAVHRHEHSRDRLRSPAVAASSVLATR